MPNTFDALTLKALLGTVELLRTQVSHASNTFESMGVETYPSTFTVGRINIRGLPGKFHDLHDILYEMERALVHAGYLDGILDLSGEAPTVG